MSPKATPVADISIGRQPCILSGARGDLAPLGVDGWLLVGGAKKSYMWFEIFQRASVHNQKASTPMAFTEGEGRQGKNTV